jgi:hypothetical protein
MPFEPTNDVTEQVSSVNTDSLSDEEIDLLMEKEANRINNIPPPQSDTSDLFGFDS